MDKKRELSDTEIRQFLPFLGYFAAQSGSYSRAHVCNERDGFRAVALCGQIADASTERYHQGSICRTCRRLVTREILAVKSDNQKLLKWKAAADQTQA